MGQHRDNPVALLHKNRPPNTQMVRVLRLENGIEVIPQPGLAWVPDADKQELVCICVATVMRPSPIVGATQPMNVAVAEVLRVPYAALEEALVPPHANGVSEAEAEPVL